MANENERTLPLDNFLFPRILRAFRISIQPTKLIIALGALVIVCLTGFVMDLVSHTAVVGQDGTTELDAYVAAVLDPDRPVAPLRETEARIGVFAVLWTFASEHLNSSVRSLFQANIYRVIKDIAACFVSLVWAFRYHPVYSAIFFGVALAAVSVAGGAICRIAALQFAGARKPGLRQAVRFSVGKFTALFSAPLTPIFVILVFGVTIILLGAWGNVPYLGELTVGLLLPTAFAAAVIVTVLAIGAVGGFSLMFPAIAYEDSDCFDAISRSFSYVYNKPWRMGLYMAIAFVYGAICYLFARAFAFLVLWFTHAFLQLGFAQGNRKLNAIWPEPTFADFFGRCVAMPTNWSTSVSSALIYFWVLVVIGLVVAFVISFYFSASTIIYALMRHRVDLIAFDDVYIGPPEQSSEAVSGQTAADVSLAATSAAIEEPDNKPEASE